MPEDLKASIEDRELTSGGMDIKNIIEYTAWLKKHMTIKEINGHHVWVNQQDGVDWSMYDDEWLVLEFKRMGSEEDITPVPGVDKK